MDDVIFSAPTIGPARNNAEVAMAIDNADRKAPAQFNEHETLDRLTPHRAGVRLDLSHQTAARCAHRDVQILLADASTARAHRPRPSGRIGRDHPAKPRAAPARARGSRRHPGLHARRHEAELLAAGGEANLARLDDVINQLGAVEALQAPGQQAVRIASSPHQQVPQVEAHVHLRLWTARIDDAIADRLLGPGA